MAKKTFKIGYSVKVYCSVLVDAETEAEALEMYNNGDIETDFWDDYQDNDGEEFEYIKSAGDLSRHFPHRKANIDKEKQNG